MSGPDCACWHGIYEVAKNFYTEFLPEAKHVAGSALYAKIVKNHIDSDVRRERFTKDMSKTQLEKI